MQRHRAHTRTEVPPKTIGVSDDLWTQLPEMAYLLEAEGVFEEACDWKKRWAEPGEPHTALVQVGDGIFEVGKVQLGSDTGAHLRTRLGIPQDEILAESEDGQYDLLMLGAHRVPGCPWSEIENGPLYVAQMAQCPVMVIGREFEKGQPLMVCIGEKDPPESALELVRVIATRMKSDIDVLTVLRRADAAFQFSPRVSSMIDEWSAISLRVTQKVITGDPVTVVLEMAPDYGLTVCSFGKRHKKVRLGKVTKRILCSQFNLLVAR